MKPSKNVKSVDANQLASFLRGVELLNGMSGEDLLRVAQSCQLVRFRRAERIFTESQPGASLYVVMDGRVKIFGSSTQGRSKTFAYLEPGDFFGEMSLIDEEVRSASASALEDSILITLKSDELRKLVLSRPSIALTMLRTLSSRDVQMIEIFRKNAFADDFIVSQMDGVPECRGTMDRHPPYFVLWTRRLH